MGRELVFKDATFVEAAGGESFGSSRSGKKVKVYLI